MQERVTITITIQKKTTFTGTINVAVLHKKGKESFMYTIVTTTHGIQLLIYVTANSEESIFIHKWIQFVQTTYLLHNLQFHDPETCLSFHQDSSGSQSQTKIAVL